MTDELSGTLRERVTIERATSAPDGAGGSVAGWSFVARAWAGIASERPGPNVEAERRSRRARFTAVLRDRGDVGLDCRLVWRPSTSLGTSGAELALRVTGVTRDPLTPDRLELSVEEMEP